jgi:hypothetical protein
MIWVRARFGGIASHSNVSHKLEADAAEVVNLDGLCEGLARQLASLETEVEAAAERKRRKEAAFMEVLQRMKDRKMVRFVFADVHLPSRLLTPLHTLPPQSGSTR